MVYRHFNAQFQFSVTLTRFVIEMFRNKKKKKQNKRDIPDKKMLFHSASIPCIEEKQIYR